MNATQERQNEKTSNEENKSSYIYIKCKKCGTNWTKECETNPCLNCKYRPEGIKHDQEKLPLDLVSPFALEELAKVLAFGKRKYSARNWEQGISYTRILGAILRHTIAYMRGESLDPETGLSHMAHVMTEASFLLHFEQTKPEFDDRPKYEINTKMSSK